MIKIINGQKYDTDTALMLAQWSSDCSCRDFHYYAEELYRKRTGEYFLSGYGGPLSKYSKQIGINEYCGGSGIKPLTTAEAKHWAEKHCSGEEYIQIFGDVDE